MFGCTWLNFLKKKKFLLECLGARSQTFWIRKCFLFLECSAAVGQTFQIEKTFLFFLNLWLHVAEHSQEKIFFFLLKKNDDEYCSIWSCCIYVASTLHPRSIHVLSTCYLPMIYVYKRKYFYWIHVESTGYPRFNFFFIFCHARTFLRGYDVVST